MFKKLLMSAAVICCFCTLTAQEVYFKDIRAKAAKVGRYSKEDYALGKELIAQMQQMASRRKPFFDRSQLFFENVLWRSARLWFSDKYWRDRSLITNRKFYSRHSKSWAQNMAISYRLMKEYDADGCNFFVIKAARHVQLDGADMCGMSPDEFKLLPTVSPQNVPYWQMSDDVLQHITRQKNVLRINGKPVYLTYDSDKHKDTRAMEKYFADVKKRSGKDLVYITDLTGNGLHVYPDTNYAVHRSVPATMLLRYFDHITDFLKVGCGVEYGVYLGKQDLNLSYDYLDQVLLPLFASACARKEFNGKKILALKVAGNYTNCNGSQTLYADGTKTLRGYLELCRKHKVDIIQGFEWDEHNENTNLEPTVAKPMAYKRIFRYYMGQLKGKKPAPLPGDDLSLPNLIVSTRRQIGTGEELELELLNVPDGSKENYQVEVEFFDQSGKVIHKSKTVNFSTADYRDTTLVIPTEKFPASLFMQPRLIVKYKGEPRIIRGLPPVVVRGTVAEDHTWFSTPLRNLMTANGKIAFSEGAKIRPGVREVQLDANVTFSDPLIAAEAVQNSQDIFVYDPYDEFRTADGMNRLFKFYGRTTASSRFDLTLDMPSAQKVVSQHANIKAQLMPLSGSRKSSMSNSSRIDEYFIVPGFALADGVLKVSGQYTAGQNKGKKFAFEFKLTDAIKAGVVSKVLSDGLHFALEVDPRPKMMALEIGKKHIAFSAPLLVNTSDSVVALRAVSQNGKIYWSEAYAPAASGKKIPACALSSKRGVVNFTLPESRVPHLSYRFADTTSGDVVTVPWGREFYGHIGGFLSVSTGFEGLMSALNVPRAYINMQSVPQRRFSADGKSASLVFDGKTTGGFFLPKTAIPQRHGFTMVLDLKPADVAREQIIFEQRGVQSYLTGFHIRLHKGKLILEFNSRQPHLEYSPLSTGYKFATGLALKPGVRQKIILRYNCSKAILEVNGKKAEFAVNGMGLWLTPSVFGGVGNKRFAGELFGIDIVHSPVYEVK